MSENRRKKRERQMAENKRTKERQMAENKRKKRKADV